jgi:hypothetical protein
MSAPPFKDIELSKTLMAMLALTTLQLGNPIILPFLKIA